MSEHPQALIISGTQAYHCLPIGSLSLLLLFPKLGVVPSEEHLLIPTSGFIVAWHDK